MLAPQQAGEQLAKWRLPDNQNRIVDEAKRLPSDLRRVAELALGLRDDDDSLDWDEQARLAHEAVSHLDSLPTNKRARIFKLIAPPMVPAMEAAWQVLKTSPYQVGYTRKAFRAPGHLDSSVPKLQQFLHAMQYMLGTLPADLATPAWLAAWTVHVGGGVVGPPCVLAAVLNESTPEGDEVFEILRLSLTNQHEIGGMGPHVYMALLLANRPDGWQLVEKTLLAAQRQEGLRQALLECIDQCHPEAFRRMLRLILDENLIRFSSVVRAVDVWFGHLWASASAGVIRKMLSQVVEFLEDDSARQRALGGRDAESAYLALWCTATEDAPASVPVAQRLLSAQSVEMRYVAARHLINLELDSASAALVPAIDDDDLRVALVAASSLHPARSNDSAELAEDDRFERVERLLARMPEKQQELKPLVWPWTGMRVERSESTVLLLNALGSRRATRLIPHLHSMPAPCRFAAARAIADARPLDDEARNALLGLAGNNSSDVRGVALQALQDVTLSPADAKRLEAYLSRKAGDLRRGVIALLLKQDDATALASAARLLQDKQINRRLAGLELLRHLTQANRARVKCRLRAAAYQERHRKTTKEERSHLDAIATDDEAAPTLDDALGLMDPAARTPAVTPRNRNVKFVTPAAVSCLRSLDDLIHKHREKTISYETYDGRQLEMLGSAVWGFPHPNVTKPRREEWKTLQLAELWTGWFDGRPKKLRDDDGLELIRALCWFRFVVWLDSPWNEWGKRSPENQRVVKGMTGGQACLKLRYPPRVLELFHWLTYRTRPHIAEHLLDAMETAYALVPSADVELLAKKDDDDTIEWRDVELFSLWSQFVSRFPPLTGHDLTPEQQIRLWQLQHWYDQPIGGAPRRRVDEELLFTAYDLQAANLSDVADHLLGPRGSRQHGSATFTLLTRLTERKRAPKDEAWLAKHPEVAQLVEAAVERILELELPRGDAPTAATGPAHAIGSLGGTDTLRRILAALGKADFKPESGWRPDAQLDRRHTLTCLAKVTFPSEQEAPADFTRVIKAAVKAEEFPEERLMQLTFLAPQWTKHLEAYLGWPQMSEGVYWFLAHMRYVSEGTEGAAIAAGEESGEEDEPNDEADDGRPAQRKLTAWERLILERTPLTQLDRYEGAIDVGWFRRTYKEIGPRRWQTLAAAARFAASPAQAKRAQLIAEVLSGKTSRKQLVDGIKKRYLKENVRLLGLLPLAAGGQRDADLRERCTVLRDYRRYANGLSGLTKPAALRAWDIGMKNLARTAGLGDPIRLEWAVGSDAVRDLAKGPVSVAKDKVTVTLSLDEQSKPRIGVVKNGKPLKSVPPAIKKDKKIAQLTARVPELKRQTSAIRQALETLMCRGDTFSGRELRAWQDHALVAPFLSRLVIVGEGIQGYPVKGGRALADHRGKLEPVKPNETLRVAHAHDLLKTGQWHAWQHECFASERIQPFKQVFRELYVPTKQEKKDGNISHRYDGQQIQPGQGMALFGSRGWNTADGVFKVFHDDALVVDVDFEFGITTPAEVEGWTLAGVRFRPRDEYTPIKLTGVPPRIFSEAMRDLDLVVSVAHAGRVDPEASASTVEMRAGLLRETCSLLKLNNVRLKSPHALVDGELADYNVHLGSGTVHRMPGGALCIVPVHAQQRGRLFLPFADDDPRTAEVVSKVLLLARDREIQDPTILEQIRG